MLFGFVFLTVSAFGGLLVAGCWFPRHFFRTKMISEASAVIFAGRLEDVFVVVVFFVVGGGVRVGSRMGRLGC